MGHEVCCVVNCKNNGKQGIHKFYKFPQASWKREQRMKWIIAVKRKNADGSPWYPKPYDRICSAHFIGGKKADEQNSLSYIPRIFPAPHIFSRVDTNFAMSSKENVESSSKEQKKAAVLDPISANLPKSRTLEIRKINKGCQVLIFSNVSNEGNTFICNRYMYSGKEICDSEVQTEISRKNKIIEKKTKHQGCNTTQKIYAHQETMTEKKYFIITGVR